MSVTDLHRHAKALGANPIKHVTKTLYVLVVGNMGSEQWVNPGKSGRKIIKVKEWNNNGSEILIIPEDQFFAIKH
jgi:hypothetical protein